MDGAALGFMRGFFAKGGGCDVEDASTWRFGAAATLRGTATRCRLTLGSCISLSNTVSKGGFDPVAAFNDPVYSAAMIEKISRSALTN